MTEELVNVKSDANCTKTLKIGKQGENKACRIRFDMSWFKETYGDGEPALLVQRSSDQYARPARDVDVDGTVITWTVNSFDTSFAGFGQIVAVWTFGDGLSKSVIYKTYVEKSLVESNAPDDPGDKPGDIISGINIIGIEVDEYGHGRFIFDTAEGSTFDVTIVVDERGSATIKFSR